MDRMNELSHGAKIVLGATIAFLIVSFFSWFHYTGPGKDELEAIGADTGISKSEVSRICGNLDEDVAAFRDRPLADTSYPYVFLDATYCKARVGRRVVSQAVVVAVGVAADGRREVLGFEVGDTESQPF